MNNAEFVLYFATIFGLPWLVMMLIILSMLWLKFKKPIIFSQFREWLKSHKSKIDSLFGIYLTAAFASMIAVYVRAWILTVIYYPPSAFSTVGGNPTGVITAYSIVFMFALFIIHRCAIAIEDLWDNNFLWIGILVGIWWPLAFIPIGGHIARAIINHYFPPKPKKVKHDSRIHSLRLARLALVSSAATPAIGGEEQHDNQLQQA